jgi:hypothetical protein
MGEIRHKRDRHPGQHQALISRELWERVQERLRSQAARSGEGRKTEARQSPLAGKLFDETGEPLYVQGAAKGRHRYRYYVSRKLVRGETAEGEQTWRLSASELERSVLAAAQSLLGDSASLAVSLEESRAGAERLPAALKLARTWLERLRSGTEADSALSQLAERVDIGREGFRISLRLPVAPDGNGDSASSNCVTLAKFFPMRLKRRGVEMRMVLEGDSTPSRVDLPLLRAVARARRWSQELISGRVESVGELAERERIDRRSVRRLLRLGFLSPRIVEAIADGRQPAELTVTDLIRRIDLPLLWSAQEQSLGIY